MNKVPRFETYALVLGCVCTIIGTWSLYMHRQSEMTATAVAYSENLIADSNLIELNPPTISNNASVTAEATLATTTPTEEPTPPVEIKEEPKPKPEPKKHVVVAAPVVVPPVVVETKVDLSAAIVNSVAMLAAHNEVRLSHNLNPLTWSNKLAVSAQGWSDKLKTESCEMRHDLDSPYGENIYWESLIGGGVDVMVSTDKDPVVWWANEEKFYNYDKNTCRRGEQCGHYTQIVWAETTEVGCGVSSCIEGDERRDLWVCRYNPPGNYEGMRPY